MVLAELGTKISNALKNLNKVDVVNEETLKTVLNEIVTALLQADVNVHQVKKMRDAVNLQFKVQSSQGGDPRNLIRQLVVTELSKMLEAEKKPYQPKKGKTNVIMLVGLQGSGKTTTCTKYAYYYQKKGWRTSLVCCDTFRAGAFDQLKQNATKCRIPFYGSYSETDPVAIAEEGVSRFKKEGFEMIIVDTSGRHKQEAELFDEMKQVAATIKPDEIIFVMDSSIGQACYDQASAFRKAVDVGSVIITKLDGHAKGGGALSAVAATESPIIFIGTGEHFDEFESFEAASFIKRLLGMGDISKIVDIVKEAVPLEDQPKLIEKITSGNFTLRDMQSQYKNILKIGSFSQFLSFLPGVGTSLMGKTNDKENIAKVKKFICIMDSMTADELDGKQPLNPSRITRIAKGSGAFEVEVNILLEEFKRLKMMIEKMGKSGLGGKGGKGPDLASLARNPQQMMGKLKGMVDPRMLQQMGGMDGLMDMMKQVGKMEGMGGLGGMGGMGGMGGLGDMMKMLGGGKK